MTSMVIVILSFVVLSMSPETMANSEEERDSLSCEITPISTYVVQEDENGRKCSGVVKIWGCKGRCLSYSIPHWRFPYKISVNPVCIHDQPVTTWASLSHCDPGVANATRWYEYSEARSCKCVTCNSSNTSCEGAHKRGKPSPPSVQAIKSVMDILLRPVKPRHRNWPEPTPQILQPPVYP